VTPLVMSLAPWRLSLIAVDQPSQVASHAVLRVPADAVFVAAVPPLERIVLLGRKNGEVAGLIRDEIFCKVFAPAYRHPHLFERST
jgi:hypothetical protein